MTLPCCHTLPHRLSNLGGITNVSLRNISTIFANPSDACTSTHPSNMAEWSGRVVFIERGQCNFTTKILQAQTAGAVAAVIYNNKHSDKNGVLMTGDVEEVGRIKIPSAFISKRSARVLEDASRLNAQSKLPVFISLNETGSFSPRKIELRGVEELTRYVIAIFLCFLLAFAMGGLLVLLVTISEQKWRSRAIRNLNHYPYLSKPSSPEMQPDKAYSAREVIRRFLATAHEYSPEFLTYLVQHAAPPLLRELQVMAVLPINDAVASIARMMASSTLEAPILSPSKAGEILQEVDEEPARFDRVRTVVQSLMSVYTEFTSHVKRDDCAGMRTRAMDKLSSTVSMLRQLLISQGYCGSKSVAIPLESMHCLTTIKSSQNCEMTCAICIDEIAEGNMVTELPCKHIFHRSCIEPWLESRSLECPLCKAQAIRRDASDAAIANVLNPVVSFFTSSWCLLFLFGLACCFLLSASISMFVPKSILIPPGTVRMIPTNADATGV